MKKIVVVALSALLSFSALAQTPPKPMTREEIEAKIKAMQDAHDARMKDAQAKIAAAKAQSSQPGKSGTAPKQTVSAEQAKQISSIGQAAGIGPINVQGMDLDTAMMAVQSNRANMLTTQLKDQIATVQAKNDQINKMNALLSEMNKLAAKVPSNAKATDKLPNWSNAEKKPFQDALVTAKVTPPALATKGDLDSAIGQLKSQIDSMSNSQQMDMLRLQSLSNKRNEAYEVMTSFIKKMQDNRSSIISNMR